MILWKDSNEENCRLQRIKKRKVDSKEVGGTQKVKVKVLPLTDHEAPEGEQRYSPTLS